MAVEIKITKAPAAMQLLMHVKYTDCITARRTCNFIMINILLIIKEKIYIYYIYL